MKKANNYLAIFDTHTKNQRSYALYEKKPLTLYVCGVTPYDFSHVGHGRCYTFFDVFLRLFRFFGREITYCRNITDIDDKIIKRALETFGTEKQHNTIAKKYYQHFIEDLDALSCIRPDDAPRVTENITEIISFIELLIERGHAYVVEGDVFFSVETYPDYGTLSQRILEEQQQGARIGINEKKRQYLDFALWKHTTTEPFWYSPWGKGRPGWHIECSVMSKNSLGTTIDFHGGGEDLLFPHHENERAQSECGNGVLFVKHWLHCAFVKINKEKMSKSLGNILSLRELFSHCSPEVVRFYFLHHHYRSPIDFSLDSLKSFEKSFEKMLSSLMKQSECYSEGREYFLEKYPEAREIMNALLDDLNTAQCIGILFKHMTLIRDNPEFSFFCKGVVQQLLGIPLHQKNNRATPATPHLSEEAIAQLLRERALARAKGDFQRADMLRKILYDAGVTVQDDKISS